jgi:hypothetical protein
VGGVLAVHKRNIKHMTNKTENGSEAKENWFLTLTENEPQYVFILIFLVSLLVGVLLFYGLWDKAIGFKDMFAMLQGGLDGGGAGGFLQGAWGTAGSLASSFVAIVLARQALTLTRKQNADQKLQDEQNDKLQQQQQELQREQNRILQQNTPEYQIAYRAAMSSTKLDSLQIIISNVERKKFRGASPTIASILKTRKPEGDEDEIKSEIKSELLGSRYIGFAADVAEKMFGANKRLEIETLASELILSSRPTLDKLLINRLNETVHNVVARCMEDINGVLNVNGNVESGPVIYRFAEYEKLKSAGNGVNIGVSKSAYYFVNILCAQMRIGGYTYTEDNLLQKIIQGKVNSAGPLVGVREALPSGVDAFNQGICVVTPFDFQRATLLVKLEFPEGSDPTSRRIVQENYRGKPDLEVMDAINGEGRNSIVFLDQIEDAQDSINKGKWLTLTEHLALWDGMKRVAESFDALEENFDFLAQNLKDYLQPAPDLSLPGYEHEKHLLERVLPRYYEISGKRIETTLGSMSNYELIFRQAESVESATFEASYKPRVDSHFQTIIQNFVSKLFTGLKDDHFGFDSLQRLLRDHSGATVLIRSLAKRPFFERPFYGWIIPDYSMECSLLTAKDKNLGFVGVHYLTEINGDYVFRPNLIYNWLVVGNTESESGPVIRESVVTGL